MAVIYASDVEEVSVIPTGLFIDNLTGIGGIPRGYITEIFGDEGIGKSSVCLQIVASAQKQGFRCLWVDVELCFNTKYSSSLGVDNSKLGLLQERFAEDLLDFIDSEVNAGNWDLVIFDSIGALSSRVEAEKSAEAKTIGLQAGLVSRFSRKLVSAIKYNNTAFIAINHQFVDLMSGKIMSSGGKKFAYHKSISIRLKQKSGVTIKQGDRKVGKVILAEVRKNKLASTEGLEIESQLIFGNGFSIGADVLNLAIDKGVVTKQGNSYFYGETKLGVGLGKARQAIENDEQLLESIKLAIK